MMAKVPKDAMLIVLCLTLCVFFSGLCTLVVIFLPLLNGL
jgi:hypothetical protein